MYIIYIFFFFISVLNNENWGPSYPLGLGQNVPTNCLCQSRPAIIEIKLLKFDTFCNNCKEEIVEKGKYCSCEARDLTLNMLLMYVFVVFFFYSGCNVQK